MQRFDALGASANAFTSFDKTAYYFSCTENFSKALEVLLDFVATPYFTGPSVRRERGIIAEELRMYRDSPEWMVTANLLQAMYHVHPIREDIAGTEKAPSWPRSPTWPPGISPRRSFLTSSWRSKARFAPLGIAWPAPRAGISVGFCRGIPSRRSRIWRRSPPSRRKRWRPPRQRLHWILCSFCRP